MRSSKQRDIYERNYTKRSSRIPPHQSFFERCSVRWRRAAISGAEQHAGGVPVYALQMAVRKSAGAGPPLGGSGMGVPPTTSQGTYVCGGWSAAVRAALAAMSFTPCAPVPLPKHLSTGAQEMPTATAHLRPAVAADAQGMAANMQVVNSTPRLDPPISVAHASIMLPSHSVGPCWHVTTPPVVCALPYETSSKVDTIVCTHVVFHTDAKVGEKALQSGHRACRRGARGEEGREVRREGVGTFSFSPKARGRARQAVIRTSLYSATATLPDCGEERGSGRAELG